MADKAIYNPDPNSTDWFDTEFGNAVMGTLCGLGMIACICRIAYCVIKMSGG